MCMCVCVCVCVCVHVVEHINKCAPSYLHSCMHQYNLYALVVSMHMYVIYACLKLGCVCVGVNAWVYCTH